MLQLKVTQMCCLIIWKVKYPKYSITLLRSKDLQDYVFCEGV